MKLNLILRVKNVAMIVMKLVSILVLRMVRNVIFAVSIIILQDGALSVQVSSQVLQRGAPTVAGRGTSVSSAGRSPVKTFAEDARAGRASSPKVLKINAVILQKIGRLEIAIKF